MKTITFLVELQEPFLATQVNNGEPNSGISYPYIPGSAIRGALVRQYLRGRKLPYDLAADSVGNDLFLTGKVRYLNAYPYVSGQRLLPKPLSWYVPKEDQDDPGATIADFAIQGNADRKKPIDKPKSPAGLFTPGRGVTASLHYPTYQVTVHNTTVTPGKKKEGDSQMYRYEALAPGQTFQGVIVADGDVDTSDLETWLREATFFLGGSATGGYGLVAIGEVQTPSTWQEYRPETSPDGAQLLTCLSDVIIRAPNGQVAGGMKDAIAGALGISTDQITAFQDVRVVGGFNRKWGLPLPQSWAIAAGSVFRIETDGDTQTLQDWVSSGVGERTAEGFGRVALNWHTQANRRQQKPTTAVAATAGALSTRSKGLAQRMANRRLQTVLEKRLQAQINKHQQFSRKMPSSTQLSRVRLAAHHALARQDLSGIPAHLDSLKGARSQWEGARVSGQPLLDWVETHSRLDEAAFTETFGLSGRLPQIAGVTAELTEAIMTEYSARLIDGVMKVAVEQVKAARES